MSVLPSPTRVAELHRKAAAMGGQDRAYCICKPTDGLLYVELSSYSALRNMLITQQWRGASHMRTKNGYVPYFGGGIAFDFRKMRLKGAHPVWYVRKGRTTEEAVADLLEDGLFPSERSARRVAEGAYPGECEWKGPPRMAFTPDDIEYVWIGKRPKDDRPFGDLAAELQEFEPGLDVRSEIPPSGQSPCKVAARWLRASNRTARSNPKFRGYESADAVIEKVVAAGWEDHLRHEARRQDFDFWVELLETDEPAMAGKKRLALERNLKAMPLFYTAFDAEGNSPLAGGGDEAKLRKKQQRHPNLRFEVDDRAKDHRKLKSLEQAAAKRKPGYREHYEAFRVRTLEIKVREAQGLVAAELWDMGEHTPVVGQVYAGREGSTAKLEGCADDMAKLMPKFGELPVWVIHRSKLEGNLQGKGWGKALYEALFAELKQKSGGKVYVSAHACLGATGATSVMARRVWKSLGRSYPSSGLVLVI